MLLFLRCGRGKQRIIVDSNNNNNNSKPSDLRGGEAKCGRGRGGRVIPFFVLFGFCFDGCLVEGLEGLEGVEGLGKLEGIEGTCKTMDTMLG